MVPGPLRPPSASYGPASVRRSPATDLLAHVLARNVSLWGYENNKPTEFLILVIAILHLARELRAIAGPDGMIRVAGCDDATRLIQVPRYQFQHGCGPAGPP